MKIICKKYQNALGHNDIDYTRFLEIIRSGELKGKVKPLRSRSECVVFSPGFINRFFYIHLNGGSSALESLFKKLSTTYVNIGMSPQHQEIILDWIFLSRMYIGIGCYTVELGKLSYDYVYKVSNGRRSDYRYINDFISTDTDIIKYRIRSSEVHSIHYICANNDEPRTIEFYVESPYGISYTSNKLEYRSDNFLYYIDHDYYQIILMHKEFLCRSFISSNILPIMHMIDDQNHYMLKTFVHDNLIKAVIYDHEFQFTDPKLGFNIKNLEFTEIIKISHFEFKDPIRYRLHNFYGYVILENVDSGMSYLLQNVSSKMKDIYGKDIYLL